MTGSHQFGVHIPKSIKKYFPELKGSTKNPDLKLLFFDKNNRKEFNFRYIHYNNKYFDFNGTRDEYRLSLMREFFKDNAAEPGDTLAFIMNNDKNYIELIKKASLKGVGVSGLHEKGWKVLSVKTKVI